MKLDELLGLPRSGVVILKKGNGVLVTYTTSMGSYLETLYQEFEGKEGMEIEVVSKGADLETLKLHTEYFRAFHGCIAQGRKAIQYRVRAVPAPEFKGVDVEIVSARGDSIMVVGKFKTAGEAKSFIETYYGADNPFRLPVYAANSATKEFLLRKQTKVLEIK